MMQDPTSPTGDFSVLYLVCQLCHETSSKALKILTTVVLPFLVAVSGDGRVGFTL